MHKARAFAFLLTKCKICKCTISLVSAVTKKHATHLFYKTLGMGAYDEIDLMHQMIKL